MSPEELIHKMNMNNIRIMFIISTFILLIALVQKLKPTFSITYHINNNPSYVKAKLISKLITSATLYICGFYFYYFSDLTKTTMHISYALCISLLLYQLYKWALTRIFEHSNNCDDH